MFANYSKVCMAVAENLSGVHNYWLPDNGLSYITLNDNKLIFFSNQEKFQVLGHPSVKWNKKHFINIDETAKRLAMEVSEQVEEYKRESKVIISVEEWLAEIEAFKLKNSEWCKRLWVDDIEKLEIESWANFLETQENPIFQDLAKFLKCHLDNDKEAVNLPEKPHFRELLKSERGAANKLADFLANHSNDLLREGSKWLPQWIEAH